MSLEDLVERALAEKAQDMSAVPDVEALVARGMQARRRRRLAIETSIVATVVIGAVAVGPMLRNTAEPAPVSGVPSPSFYPTATVGPGRGTSYFAGSRPDVDVTFTMPVGWEIADVIVIKSGSEPEIGVAFVDVANIYTDGCQWRLVDPMPGPSVDDLVSAYAKVPGSETAEDVTIDGYEGKQIQVTIPDYNERDCKEGGFALLQEDNDSGRGDRPLIVAGAPRGQYKMNILDVDGTRLVIFVDYPQSISAQDRADLDGILSSIEIG